MGEVVDPKIHTASVYWPDSDTLEQYPYHLGTDEVVARTMCAGLWRWYPDRGRKESIALWYAGRVVAYYDGQSWSDDSD